LRFLVFAFAVVLPLLLFVLPLFVFAVILSAAKDPGTHRTTRPALTFPCAPLFLIPAP
jgi:hypothetical protein